MKKIFILFILLFWQIHSIAFCREIQLPILSEIWEKDWLTSYSLEQACSFPDWTWSWNLMLHKKKWHINESQLKNHIIKNYLPTFQWSWSDLYLYKYWSEYSGYKNQNYKELQMLFDKWLYMSYGYIDITPIQTYSFAKKQKNIYFIANISPFDIMSELAPWWVSLRDTFTSLYIYNCDTLETKFTSNVNSSIVQNTKSSEKQEYWKYKSVILLLEWGNIFYESNWRIFEYNLKTYTSKQLYLSQFTMNNLYKNKIAKTILANIETSDKLYETDDDKIPNTIDDFKHKTFIISTWKIDVLLNSNAWSAEFWWQEKWIFSIYSIYWMKYAIQLSLNLPNRIISDVNISKNKERWEHYVYNK